MAKGREFKHGEDEWWVLQYVCVMLGGDTFYRWAAFESREAAIEFVSMDWNDRRLQPVAIFHVRPKDDPSNYDDEVTVEDIAAVEAHARKHFGDPGVTIIQGGSIPEGAVIEMRPRVVVPKTRGPERILSEMDDVQFISPFEGRKEPFLVKAIKDEKHPAARRPSLYTGDKGSRTQEEWERDAVEAYNKGLAQFPVKSAEHQAEMAAARTILNTTIVPGSEKSSIILSWVGPEGEMKVDVPAGGSAEVPESTIISARPQTYNKMEVSWSMPEGVEEAEVGILGDLSYNDMRLRTLQNESQRLATLVEETEAKRESTHPLNFVKRIMLGLRVKELREWRANVVMQIVRRTTEIAPPDQHKRRRGVGGIEEENNLSDPPMPRKR